MPLSWRIIAGVFLLSAIPSFAWSPTHSEIEVVLHEGGRKLSELINESSERPYPVAVVLSEGTLTQIRYQMTSLLQKKKVESLATAESLTRRQQDLQNGNRLLKAGALLTGPGTGVYVLKTKRQNWRDTGRLLDALFDLEDYPDRLFLQEKLSPLSNNLVAYSQVSKTLKKRDIGGLLLMGDSPAGPLPIPVDPFERLKLIKQSVAQEINTFISRSPTTTGRRMDYLVRKLDQVVPGLPYFPSTPFLPEDPSLWQKMEKLLLSNYKNLLEFQLNPSDAISLIYDWGNPRAIYDLTNVVHPEARSAANLFREDVGVGMWEQQLKKTGWIEGGKMGIASGLLAGTAAIITIALVDHLFPDRDFSLLAETPPVFRIWDESGKFAPASEFLEGLRSNMDITCTQVQETCHVFVIIPKGMAAGVLKARGEPSELGKIDVSQER